ncbi:CBS domain-containing protein [Thalassotalea aquiviva]|uniref:CBS domain-containing protein n=1 Tax=Thalassotalea aquiviva TaxID=3242415 RepID=UPI003529E46B
MRERKYVAVEKAMDNSFIICDGLETVAEAITKVKQQHVNTIIIQKRHPQDEYGVVLLSDIAKQVIAKDRSPERTNLYEIMTKPVLGVLPDMDVRYCARLFEQFGLNRAPVIKDHEILGMVSYDHIALS